MKEVGKKLGGLQAGVDDAAKKKAERVSVVESNRARNLGETSMFYL